MVNETSKALRTEKKTDITHRVALMGGLCPLGAQCCAFAMMTFKKYFHNILNLKGITILERMIVYSF